MKYKLPINGDEFRSVDYRGTVKSKHDPDLLAIKENVRAINKHRRAVIKQHFDRLCEMPRYCSLMRVQLMARGPRTIPALTEGYSPRSFDQSLPHKYATHFDVYVREDTYAMWRMEYQLTNGLTPGQHALIEKMETKKRLLEMDMFKELRANGIQAYGKAGSSSTHYRGIS